LRDVMVDTETYGTAPGSIILSIGAIGFDPETGELGSRFYKVFSMEDSKRIGMTEDPETVAWWGRQSVEARKVISEARASNNTVEAVLTRFREWFQKNYSGNGRIWGCGANFDEPLITAAYAKVNAKLDESKRIIPPYRFWNSRCYRTLKEEWPMVKLGERTGTYHNALGDAETQAVHALQIMAHKKQVFAAHAASQIIPQNPEQRECGIVEDDLIG
jgi:hypothetical protein